MRLHHAFLGVLAVLALALVPARDAAACGGCFILQAGQTQVSGHRMALSISKTQTTLWDQITYAGDPQSFAWVLPIKGKVDVGISSDALFGNLERLTRVTVSPPVISCPPPPACADDDPLAPTDDPKSDVAVLAAEVVGPYETVQLSSQDPEPLKIWLSDHQFSIPDDISPTLSAYVAEGFNFLALKLVPGQGIQSMKPVRVTTPGASPVLPLRMVAAGTGATVPITLWVLGEGKYVPSNFPSFTVPEDKLVWDWDAYDSNYKSLRQEGFAVSSNKGWQIEASDKIYPQQLTSPLLSLVLGAPNQSGYGDGMSIGPTEAVGADIDALLGDIDRSALKVTRLYAELAREALATDLTLEAASDQATVKHDLKASQSVGQAPVCPTYKPCPTFLPPKVTVNGNGMSPDSGCACASAGEGDASAARFSALLALGLALVCRRRKARRALLS